MSQYTETSLIFIVLNYIYRYFTGSVTYKVFISILNSFKHSGLNRLINKYLGRNSSLKYSVTFRLCSRIFSFFSRLWDMLYSFGEQCGNSSYVISFISNSFCGARSFEAYGLVILFFSIGFCASSLFLGTLGTLQIILSGTGILASLLLFIGRAGWEACLKNSIFRRIVIYFFD